MLDLHESGHFDPVNLLWATERHVRNGEASFETLDTLLAMASNLLASSF